MTFNLFFKKLAIHVFCLAGTQEKFRTFCRTECMQNMIVACQMYASNIFNNKEMTDWENKPKITKNNFILTRQSYTLRASSWTTKCTNRTAAAQ